MPKKVEIDMQQVIQLYNDGYKIAEIAKKIGCGKTTIRERLGKAGIDTSRSRKQYQPFKNTEEEIFMFNMNPLDKMDIKDYEDKEQYYRAYFKVVDLKTANIALKKIRAYKKQQYEMDNLIESEIARLRRWNLKEKNKTQDTINFFEESLKDYLTLQMTNDPDFTISTPYGKVKHKKSDIIIELEE